MSSASEQSQQRYRAAISLMADGASVEVTAALGADGVRSIVLKGPALAEWLYADGTERSYGDTDLLVAPGDLDVARRVLRARGFEVQRDQLPPPGEAIHAEPFRRAADGAAVDLHRTLFGCGVSPQRVWPVVSARTEPLPIGGLALEAPRLEVRALVVALHAAQHGPEAAKPVEDLRRALAVGDFALWERTAALAREVHAELPFAVGLGTLPEGRRLGRSLGLIDPAEASQALTGSGTLAQGLERVLAAPGARAKLRLLARELFPTAEEIRWQDQSMGRPSRFLGVAYLRRLLRLLRQSPASVRAVRQSYGRRHR